MNVDGLGDLRAWLADPDRVERMSTLVTAEPLVVRGGDGDPHGLDPLARVPTVTVLVGEAPDEVGAWFDVRVGSDDDAASVAESVAAHPIASLSLAGLMRQEHASVWDGIAAESAVYATLLGGREYRRWLATNRARNIAGDRPAVGLDRDGGVLRITLDRPDAHNAFNREMRDLLVEALRLAALDGAITSIDLRGRGASFCSGGDLAEFGEVDDPSVAHAVRLTRHPGWWMYACGDRVVSHLHGACAGAGIELPAFGARVVADPRTRFWLPEVRMGLIPGAGGTVSVRRRIGRQRCCWLALTGSVLDAPTALQWGLVDEVTSVGELSPRGEASDR